MQTGSLNKIKGCPTYRGALQVAQKERDNLLSDENWMEQGSEFEESFLALGESVNKKSQEFIDNLNPDVVEDRIQLIALDFFVSREKYLEVFNHYVRHPTKAEIEEMKKEFEAKFGPLELPKVSEGQSNIVVANPGFPAPDSVEEKHLKPEYQYCFEFFWMAPKKGKTMKGYRGTLSRALDQLKEENGDQPDIRDLLE
jgi:hypothetical protein